MRGSRLALAVIVLAFATVLWFTQRPTGRKAGTSAEPSTVSAKPASATPASEIAIERHATAVTNAAAPATPLLKTRSGLPQPPPPAVDDEAIERDLTHVQLMFREYRDLLGENPVGNNAEIMKAVFGGNKKQAKIGMPEGQGMNADGELLDRWGTPYFFHQVSRDKMEVRSAGPDRQMWTADDRQM